MSRFNKDNYYNKYKNNNAEQPGEMFRSPPKFNRFQDKSGYKKNNFQVFSKQNNYEPKEKFTRGMFDIADFGQYKDQSFYEIANNNKFGYLEWCLKNEYIDIAPVSKTHINTALQTKEYKNAKWQKQEETNENVSTVYWVCTVNGKEIKSPPIVSIKCSKCNQYKHQNLFTVTKETCNTCCSKELWNI